MRSIMPKVRKWRSTLLLDLSSALKLGEEMPSRIWSASPAGNLGETVTYPDPIELTGIMQASEGKIRQA